MAQSQDHGQHPKNQTEPHKARDLVKPGSTIDPKGQVPAGGQQQGQQGQQPAPAWPQQVMTDDDRAREQERQQQAWDAAAEREKSNNPATKKLREYSKNDPGMHPANQPAPDTKMSKGTRLDLEDLTGNPGHRGVNPDAPAGSINPPPDDKTGRLESINEPSHIDQNMPPAGTRDASAGVAGSINEPPGSQVIPAGAGQGAGGAAGGVGTEYETPDIEALEPDEVELGAADVTVTISGSGFTPQSAVEVEGEVQSSSFIDEGEMTIVMKPSQYSAAGVVNVIVKNGAYESEPVEFEFLEAGPVASRQSKRTKPKPPGKGKGKSKGKR
ncbi:MAG TPA: IPT/TIG domain-containing protein [Xanthobacteraceae bacterium]|nr:IPT/TIG domain-containing protein [Xanthobacteraceae bacterium]